MKLAIVFGTRPEIIKLAPVISAATKCSEVNLILIHSGQHYEYEMSQVFLKQLKLPSPHFHLEAGSGTHAEQTAKMLVKLERVLLNHCPRLVIVQGDTNTTLAGGLTPAKLKIPVAHVEAGCRSFDLTMPEEINRIIVDHISTLLFSPSVRATQNLLKEGISSERIYECGNTQVDIIQEALRRAKRKSFYRSIEFNPHEYAVVTLHRPENVDDPYILKKIITILTQINVHLVFPVHPRTRQNLIKFNLMKKLKKSENVILTVPKGYFEFTFLLENAKFVLTDSGGIQEEAAILHIPCLTMRNKTEWPETVEVGANILVGTNARKIIGISNSLIENKDLYEKMSRAPNPFGSSEAGKRIVRVVQDFLGSHTR